MYLLTYEIKYNLCFSALVSNFSGIIIICENVSFECEKLTISSKMEESAQLDTSAPHLTKLTQGND